MHWPTGRPSRRSGFFDTASRTEATQTAEHPPLDTALRIRRLRQLRGGFNNSVKQDYETTTPRRDRSAGTLPADGTAPVSYTRCLVPPP